MNCIIYKHISVGQYYVNIFMENVDNIFHICNNAQKLTTRSFWLSESVFSAYSSRAIEYAWFGNVNSRTQCSKTSQRSYKTPRWPSVHTVSVSLVGSVEHNRLEAWGQGTITGTDRCYFAVFVDNQSCRESYVRRTYRIALHALSSESLVRRGLASLSSAEGYSRSLSYMKTKTLGWTIMTSVSIHGPLGVENEQYENPGYVAHVLYCGIVPLRMIPVNRYPLWL
jgi:hypothetical protein